MAAPPAAAGPGPRIDLLVLGEHRRDDLDYPGGTVEQRTSRLGAYLHEISDPRLQPGIHAGWLQVRQQDNPVTDGLTLSGYFAGVGLRSYLFHRSPVGFNSQVRYTWHATGGRAAGRDIELEWTELSVRAGPVVRWERLRWGVGGYAIAIDGEQTVGGATTDFEEDRRTGAYTSLDLLLDGAGYVGVHADTGGNAGIHLVFGRTY